MHRCTYTTLRPDSLVVILASLACLQVYAMARDSLLPRSDLFSKVNDRGVPVNALVLLTLAVLALGPMVRGVGVLYGGLQLYLPSKAQD